MLSAPAASPSGFLHLPLPGSPCPTSSFGSRRTTHLHAGLDFSTGGQIGVPVLAVDTCWIWRISVKNGGYGRALYAVLPGGEVAVYGHLSKFAAPIEKMVEEEQNRQGVYEVELYNEPGQFRFEPGDTIALSGDTGAGPAHLHFELRSGQVDHDDLSPVPGRLDLTEDVSPTIEKIRIYPLSSDYTVNGEYKPLTIGRTEAGPVLKLTGAFGVGVYATDVVRCERVISPTTFEASIDGETVWRLDLSVFPFAKGHFSTFLYDVVGGTPYVRMFDPYGLDLEGFACYRPSGLRFFRNVAPGPHTLRVIVGDPWGNTDDVVVPFTYGAVPDFQACSIEETGERIGFRASAAGGDCSLRVSYRRGGGAWLEAEATGDGQEWSGLLPPGPAGAGAGARAGAGRATAAVDVLLRLVDASGFGRECLLGSGGGGEETHIETRIRPDYIEIIAHTPSPPRSLPLAEIAQGGDVVTWVLQPAGKNMFRGYYRPGDADGPIEIRAMFEFDRTSVERTARVPLERIRPGKTTVFSVGDFSIEMSSRRGNMETVAVASEADRVPYRGFDGSDGTISFEPEDVFFQRGVDVVARAGAGAVTARHGLFSLASGGPGLVGTFDSAGECRGRIYTLDPLAILEDARPPSVRFLGTFTRKRDGTATFAGTASDAGSGVASESIRASVDGEPAIASYDPDNGRIKVRTTKPLPYGKHLLRLEARDRIGNTGQSEVERELLK